MMSFFLLFSFLLFHSLFSLFFLILVFKRLVMKWII